MIHNDPHGLPPGSLVLASRLLCWFLVNAQQSQQPPLLPSEVLASKSAHIWFWGVGFLFAPHWRSYGWDCQLRIVALDGFNRFACPVGMGETSCCSGTFLGRLLMAFARVLSVDAAFFGV